MLAILAIASLFNACNKDSGPSSAEDIPSQDSSDMDNDGYPNPEDCNDNDSTIYPGAIEIVDDRVDQDCDGRDRSVSDVLYENSGIILPEINEEALQITKDGVEYYSDMLFIAFQSDSTEEEKQQALESVNGEIIGQLDTLGNWVRIPEQTDMESLEVLAQNLMTQSGVEEAGIEGVVYLSDETQLDYLNSDVAGDPGTWAYDRIELQKAYLLIDQAAARGDINASRQVLVAVIDAAFDVTHPELEDRLMLDYNGYPAINFATQGTDLMEIGIESAIDHGTAVAGVIAAANNGIWINGVMIQSPVFPLAVGSPGKIYGVKIDSSDLSSSIKYAVDAGAEVINISGGEVLSETWAYLFEVSTRRALNYATERNVIVVAAAGNDNIDVDDYFPANQDGVLAIGGTKEDESQNARYYNDENSASNYGNIDVAAPAQDFLILNYDSEDYMQEDYLRLGSGTSYAAPFVSGLIGLALEVRSFEDYTDDEVFRSWIYQMSDIVPVDTSNYGWPRINAYRTLYQAIYPHVEIDLCCQKTATITGTQEVLNVGSILSSAGDLNKDGYDELLTYGGGKAYLFYGPIESNLYITHANAFIGDFYYYDTNFYPLGDLDKDGFEDFLIGRKNDNDDTGAVYLFNGQQEKFNGEINLSQANTIIRGEGFGDEFGTSATTGDVNGDDYLDLMIGAPYVPNLESGESTGAAYLFYGPLTEGEFTASGADAIFRGDLSGEKAGYAVTISDLDGDNSGDLLIAAPNYPGDYDEFSDRGAVYVVYGRQSLEGENLSYSDSKLIGESSSDYLGRQIAFLGDYTGDGLDDIAILGEDTAYTLPGSHLILEGENEIQTLADNIISGYAFYSASYEISTMAMLPGDINEDGYYDLAFGGPQNYGTYDTGGGSVFIFTPPLFSGKLETSLANIQILPEDQYANTGQTLAWANVTGDQREDLIVGAPEYDATGRIYILSAELLADKNE